LVENENARYIQAIAEFVKTLNTKCAQEKFVEEVRTCEKFDIFVYFVIVLLGY
jgi:hypothetical protein